MGYAHQIGRYAVATKLVAKLEHLMIVNKIMLMMMIMLMLNQHC